MYDTKIFQALIVQLRKCAIFFSLVIWDNDGTVILVEVIQGQRTVLAKCSFENSQNIPVNHELYKEGVRCFIVTHSSLGHFSSD